MAISSDMSLSNVDQTFVIKTHLQFFLKQVDGKLILLTKEKETHEA